MYVVTTYNIIMFMFLVMKYLSCIFVRYVGQVDLGHYFIEAVSFAEMDEFHFQEQSPPH